MRPSGSGSDINFVEEIGIPWVAPLEPNPYRDDDDDDDDDEE